MELSTRHFVRPADHNHHQTLYAGRLSDWMTEAAMIGVTNFLGDNEHVVLVAIQDLTIQKPVTAGMILELYYEIKGLGTTSIQVGVLAKNMLTGEDHAFATCVFVTTDSKGQKTPHHLSL